MNDLVFNAIKTILSLKYAYPQSESFCIGALLDTAHYRGISITVEEARILVPELREALNKIKEN